VRRLLSCRSHKIAQQFAAFYDRWSHYTVLVESGDDCEE
jgi:hypothetical protein